MLDFKSTSKDSSAKSFKKHMTAMNKQVKAGINRGFLNSKKPMKDFTLEKMREKKSGRTYKVYVGIGGRPLKRPRTHVASARHEIPAIITGTLARSLGFNIKYGMVMSYGSKVGGASDYAAVHENSGRTYLKKTMAKTQGIVASNIEDAIMKQLRKQQARLYK